MFHHRSTCCLVSYSLQTRTNVFLHVHVQTSSLPKFPRTTSDVNSSILHTLVRSKGSTIWSMDHISCTSLKVVCVMWSYWKTNQTNTLLDLNLRFAFIWSWFGSAFLVYFHRKESPQGLHFWKKVFFFQLLVCTKSLSSLTHLKLYRFINEVNKAFFL